MRVVLVVVPVVVVLALAAACNRDRSSSSTAPSSAAAAASTVATTDGAVDAPTETTMTTTETTTETTATTPATTAGSGPATTATTVAATGTSAPFHPNVEVRSAGPLARELADDLLTGRQNGTLGSELARGILTAELASFAQPLPGLDGFELPFDDGVDSGTSLVAIVPGSDLADEYVMIGAHYDHLGDDCRRPTVDDTVCNGAADNAAGVAAAVEAARAVAGVDPRRSVVIALWDAEEDGLVGSRAFVDDPPVPLGQVVAYLNLDLLGANLLPSLADHTVVIGAESGGSQFREQVSAAVADAGLTPVDLSVVFGQGRSDHAPFAEIGVPVVFFSDSTNGCYHTVDDEIERVDIGKLDRQLRGVTSALVSLSSGELTPERSVVPLVTLADVAALRDLVRAGRPDLDLLGAVADDAEAFLAVLDRIVDEGDARFDDADVDAVLGGAGLLVEALAAQECR